MAKQLALFCDAPRAAAVGTRVQRRARRVLGAYVAGALRPSFALRRLAEEQARLALLREAERRGARRPSGRASKLGRVAYLVSPAGARVRRQVQACVRRIEQLEAVLLCA